jgi:hypothetical protein
MKAELTPRQVSQRVKEELDTIKDKLSVQNIETA